MVFMVSLKRPRRKIAKWPKQTGLPVSEAKERFLFFNAQLSNARKGVSKKGFVELLSSLEAKGVLPEVQRKRLVSRAWKAFLETAETKIGSRWFEFAKGMRALLYSSKSLGIREKRAILRSFFAQSSNTGQLLWFRTDASLPEELPVQHRLRIISGHETRDPFDALKAKAKSLLRKKKFVDPLSEKHKLLVKYRKELKKLGVSNEQFLAAHERIQRGIFDWVMNPEAYISAGAKGLLMEKIHAGIHYYDVLFLGISLERLPEQYIGEQRDKIVPIVKSAFDEYADLIEKNFQNGGPDKVRNLSRQRARFMQLLNDSFVLNHEERKAIFDKMPKSRIK